MRVMQLEATTKDMDLDKNIEPDGSTPNGKAKKKGWKDFFTLGEVGG